MIARNWNEGTMKKEYDFKKMKRRPGPPRVDTSVGREPISLRLEALTMIRLKEEAYRLGIPYQTLIGSILHRFVTGELIDKKTLKPHSG